MNCELVPLIFVFTISLPILISTYGIMNDYDSMFFKVIHFISLFAIAMFVAVLPVNQIDENIRLYYNYCVENFTFF